MEKFGSHVQIPKKSGIIKNSPLTALAFFLSSPQSWKLTEWKDVEKDRFKKTLQECPNLDGSKIVVHGCYLINPASTRDEVVQNSHKRFLEEIALCEELGIEKYVFHPGVNKDTQFGLQKCLDLVNLGLSKTNTVNILVENMTKTNTLCQTWQEIDWILKRTDNHKRTGLCLDTAHSWEAKMAMDTLLDDCDKTIGIDRLGAIHLNDSKVEYGANRDRHEDLFCGKIYPSFWKDFVFDKRVKNVPAILETPTNCHSLLQDFIQQNA